jgi:hypothetical protein
MGRTTERMKLHWDIWGRESKEFWRRMTWCSIAILISTFYQTRILTFSVSWLQVSPPDKIDITVHIFLLLWSLYLLLLMGFSFVDLMRHRVPDVMEPYIHNNFLPGKPLHDTRMRKAGVVQRVELLEGLTGERIEERLKTATKEDRRAILRGAGLGLDLRRFGRQLYNLVFVYFGILFCWTSYVAIFVFKNYN